jgi:hypothetical protein
MNCFQFTLNILIIGIIKKKHEQLIVLDSREVFV